ncbi:phospho-N-acetylmuramoyl-pentapeptide-transferase [Candidatus Saccharibacteria bacterium]|jgi:phospho-N-acetylmuramoyl-pentapeptide-transferase|nr:phospho-N-acetylmuramoyl-pentapeptide-transferase [Candidatus Saccharibacteria bacterium]
MNEQQLIQNFTFVLIQASLSFGIAIALTPVYTYFAFKFKLWKQIRTTTTTGEKAKVFTALHAAKHKRNIPTMAGIIMVIAISIVTLLLNLSRSQTYLPLFGLVAAGAIGLLDDFINIRGSGKGVAGLRSIIKFSLILLIATAGALYFFFRLGYSILHVPAVGDFDIGLLYIPLFILVIVSTSNAVNITDGLDGLSGGLLASAFGAFAIIALAQGNIGIAGFCMAVVGAVLAYTWFNIFPARFFMGDIGSFALGTALGVVAMLTNSVFVLPIIGLVFVLEAGSSLIQILSKKIFKRKIFISAPLHHHLEAKGWPETKITMRLWIIGAITAALGAMIGLVGKG